MQPMGLIFCPAKIREYLHPAAKPYYRRFENEIAALEGGGYGISHFVGTVGSVSGAE